jgi:molybdenum cofactor guanylyltransferase
MSPTTAFILAGGKSTRMGRDKAFLQFDGETLLCRMLKLAGAVAQEVRIVGDRKKFLDFASVVEDVYADRGPLGGIHTALAVSATELNLILAVDLPFLKAEFLKYLAQRALESNAVATVPRIGEYWQPLCAVYRREFVSAAETALRAGKNKIDPLFAQLTTRIIDREEFVRAGFSEEMFHNLNTPNDLKKAEEHFRREKMAQ